MRAQRARVSSQPKPKQHRSQETLVQIALGNALPKADIVSSWLALGFRDQTKKTPTGAESELPQVVLGKPKKHPSPRALGHFVAMLSALGPETHGRTKLVPDKPKKHRSQKTSRRSQESFPTVPKQPPRETQPRPKQVKSTSKKNSC